MKTKKITAVVLSMVMLLTLLTGCGMNKEKAIEQMGEALNAGYEMNSGKISAQMNAQVTWAKIPFRWNLQSMEQ